MGQVFHYYPHQGPENMWKRRVKKIQESEDEEMYAKMMSSEQGIAMALVNFSYNYMPRLYGKDVELTL